MSSSEPLFPQYVKPPFVIFPYELYLCVQDKAYEGHKISRSGRSDIPTQNRLIFSANTVSSVYAITDTDLSSNNNGKSYWTADGVITSPVVMSIFIGLLIFPY